MCERWDFNYPNLEIVRSDTKYICCKTSCACGENTHTIQFDVEQNEEYPDIALTFYANIQWSDYWVGTNFREHRWDYSELKNKKFIKDHPRLYKFIERIQYLDFKICRIWRRIKCAIKVLCTGSIEFEHGFCFRNKKQAEELISGMQQAINTLKNKED